MEYTEPEIQEISDVKSIDKELAEWSLDLYKEQLLKELTHDSDLKKHLQKEVLDIDFKKQRLLELLLNNNILQQS